jgi:hypothetical protein
MVDVRLIDANALTQSFEAMQEGANMRDYVYLMGVLSMIDNAPTIGAVDVVHGRWIEEVNRDEFGDCIYIDHTCSACRVTEHFVDEDVRRFCPNCGAKMDAKEE